MDSSVAGLGKLRGAGSVMSWDIDIDNLHLGGCPYAPGAKGNVATEDVVYMLNGLGLKTNINLEQLIETGRWISEQLGRETNSRAAAALIVAKARKEAAKAAKL